VDIIYHLPPHIFLHVFYLERFQNKSDICHILCEELFIRPGAQNLAESGPLATVGMALANTPKKNKEMIVNPEVVEVYTS